MAIQVRRNGAWVDNTGEKKRVNGSWVNNSPYKVMKPTISGVPPFAFKSDGENLRDWSMSGQTVQASTPTPSSPVDVSGVGERTGNLVDISTAEKGRLDNGEVGYASATTALSVSDGTISFTTSANYRGCCCGFVEIPTGAESLTLRGTFTGEDGIGKKFVFYDSQKTWLNADVTVSATQSTSTATIPASAKYVRLSFTGQRASDYTISNLMLNTGSTAQPFEPYGYTVPITCGGQTTNIYLGSATSTRKIKKLVLTGTENVGLQSINQYGIANFYLTIANLLRTELVCTHFPMQTTGISTTTTEGVYTAVGASYPFYIRIYSTTASTKAELQAWLAQQYANGTPVTIWYVLATPETAAVNEPLMKIGTYADEITKTSTGVDIPTVSGSNTLTVGTTAQPSEMSIESISQWV